MNSRPADHRAAYGGGRAVARGGGVVSQGSRGEVLALLADVGEEAKKLARTGLARGCRAARRRRAAERPVPFLSGARVGRTTPRWPGGRPVAERPHRRWR